MRGDLGLVLDVGFLALVEMIKGSMLESLISVDSEVFLELLSVLEESGASFKGPIEQEEQVRFDNVD